MPSRCLLPSLQGCKPSPAPLADSSKDVADQWLTETLHKLSCTLLRAYQEDRTLLAL